MDLQERIRLMHPVPTTTFSILADEIGKEGRQDTQLMVDGPGLPLDCR
jgi:hypothetical protein